MGKKKNPVQASLRSKNKICERAVGWKNNSGKMLPELTPCTLLFSLPGFFWGGGGGEGAYFTKVLLIFLLKANTILFVSCTFLYKNWTKLISELKEINAFRVLSTILDCKTVGYFFSKSVKKSVKRGIRVEPHTPVLASLAIDFQPRSRPFV